MATIKERIETLFTIMKDSRESIAKIQNEECPHPTTHVSYYEYRVGATHVMRICSDCFFVVGSVSDEEYKEFTGQDRGYTAASITYTTTTKE